VTQISRLYWQLWHICIKSTSKIADTVWQYPCP